MANQTLVVVAGGTGNLGGRIVKALLKRNTQVRVLAQPGTDSDRVTKLESQGAEVHLVALSDSSGLTEFLTGADCVVSALQGLRDVMVDGQTQLLQAALAAGVPRFIPSDFSVDYMELVPGDNRNFDLRREFFHVIDKADIQATSVFNGSFEGIFAYGTPLFDGKKHTVGYWENPDWKIDFSTMDDAAAFTAAAALDQGAPRSLHIASFQLSPRELRDVGEQITGQDFALIDMGSIPQLLEHTRQARSAHPEGEQDVNAPWQGMQYLVSMLQGHSGPADNSRYSGLTWATPEKVLQAGT